MEKAKKKKYNYLKVKQVSSEDRLSGTIIAVIIWANTVIN